MSGRKRPLKDGPEAICKSCKSIKFKERRKAPGFRESHREYERNKKRNEDRVKLKARRDVRQAIISGRMKRPESCQECGSVSEIHGHHIDYTRPLDVDWLCAKCHSGRHAKLRLKP